MKPRQVIGLLISAASAAAFGYSLYRMIDIGTCSSTGFNQFGPTNTCPSGIGAFFGGLFGGVFGLLLGAFLAGNAIVIWSGLFIAAGLGGALSGSGVGIFLAALFIPMGIAPLFLGSFGKKKRQLAASLMHSGLKGSGVVTQIDDTGVTINDNPRVKLHFRITPQDGSAPFDAEKSVTVSRVSIPRVGDTYPVWYDADDHAKFAFGMASNQQGAQTVARLLQQMPVATGVGAVPPAPASNGGGDAALDTLEQLADLHKQGVLTDAEFQAKKAKLLSGM